ncbi:MAG TPA: ABC transporter ATP-binding protein [Nocardioidaceae bacterium]|nr:ABC transporter ATP-binding protein [Nocardioidaceae bacterium]
MTTTSLSTASSPTVDAGTAIRINGVSKTFGRGADFTVALKEVDLDVAEREFLCIVGASGCGKSTLLNLIADLDQPSTGTIDTGGRKVAFMFQEATLFPWLTAGQNVDLALKMRGMPKSERGDRVAELLQLVHLGGRQDKRPHELSGGMRQRTQLARVLAQEAEIVLMDEPFAALDAMTRDSMHDEIERIHAELGLTIVFVTHNVREAVRLADRTVLFFSSPGRVKTEFTIPFDRPRHFEQPGIAELSGQLTDQLKAEVAAHVR